SVVEGHLDESTSRFHSGFARRPMPSGATARVRGGATPLAGSVGGPGVAAPIASVLRVVHQARPVGGPFTSAGTDMPAAACPARPFLPGCGAGAGGPAGRLTRNSNTYRAGRLPRVR